MNRSAPMKRTAFARVGILAQSSAARLKADKPKMRKCRVSACRKPYTSAQPFVLWCSPDCGAALALDKLAKKKAKVARADRVETKRKLDGFKTIPKLKAEAQTVFNKYIRARDEGLGCICCGKFATAAALSGPGGAYDACHFRSRGSADHLRFDERNTHLGLKDCNTWGHVDYRGGLIRRIGLEAVEALESDQTLVKWTRELLLSIKATYAAKLKAMKAGQP
jgi:hypothetical protein